RQVGGNSVLISDPAVRVDDVAASNAAATAVVVNKCVRIAPPPCSCTTNAPAAIVVNDRLEKGRGQYLTAGATPIYCDCDFPTTRGPPSTALRAGYCAAKTAPGSPRRHERPARHPLLRRLPDFGTRRPTSPKLLSPPSPTLRGRFFGDAGQF